MIETRPIPALAMRTATMMQRDFDRAIDVIGQETVAAMGLSESDNWRVDFGTGMMTRELPDPPTPAAPEFDDGAPLAPDEGAEA